MAEKGQQITDAILNHLETGSYPESQELVASELPASTIPTLSKAIAEARANVEKEVRSISRTSANDVDGWISEARRLQRDIEQSKRTARDIVQEAEAAKTLTASVKDAGNKVRLLQQEVDFTQSVADTLEQLQIGSGLLDSAASALNDEDFLLAIDKLDEANKVVEQLGNFGDCRFAGLLQRRATQIHEDTAKKAWMSWDTRVHVDTEARSIGIDNTTEEATTTSIHEMAAILARLGLTHTMVSRLHRDIDNVIISPRFTPAADGAFVALNFDKGSISVVGRSEDKSAANAIHDLRLILSYLNEKLPEDVSRPLMERLLPSLELQLITDWLDPAMPIRLDQMASFETTLAVTSDFATYLSSFEVTVPSDADISQWVQRVPQVWLARRKEAMLLAFRTAARTAVQDRQSAELIETQIVHEDEDAQLYERDVEPARPTVNAPADTDEAWGAEWDDEPETTAAVKTAAAANNASHGEEEEDVSAWGLEAEDEDEEEMVKPATFHPAAAQEAATAIHAPAEGEDEEAWGWGGEDDADQHSQPKTPIRPTKSQHSSPAATKKSAPIPRKSGPKEVTLRETYAVTALPTALLSQIQSILTDSSALASPESPLPRLTAAAPALSSLPTLLLAFYRATASTYYTHSQTANMLMYNDVQHLTSLLTSLIHDLPATHPLAKRLRLDNDLKQLSTFAKRAYGREMDSQRTILGDLLAGTSGFANCTSPINAREYKGTIEIVIERVKQVNTEWTGVLAESIRLQSVGQLLSTVITKTTADIIELADSDGAGISDEQSQILKGYCDQISLLSMLFEQAPHGAEHSDRNEQISGHSSGQTRDLTPVYVPGWLRFRYLAEVLEASLADIKYMWVESGLSLEFERSEVIDLIEALFADSDYRRNAIREIKSSHSGP